MVIPFVVWLVWHSGNSVDHMIGERVYHPGIYPGYSGPLSLAIPPWVDAMSTGDGFVLSNCMHIAICCLFFPYSFEY